MDDSPTARALHTLELLQDAPVVRAESLARSLGVSERAARRYIGILREAGVPVESERGPYGGYRLGRGGRMPPLVFTSEEALSLVMAVLDGHHAAGDTDDPVGSALGKLMRSLPERVAAQASTVRALTAAAPDRAAVRPDPATTATLVQAIAEERLVALDYRSEAGNAWTTTVEPWAVVVRNGRWYLLCRSRRSGDTRSYRIDRVQAVDVLDETFDPPHDLDAVALVEDSLGSGWEYDARVLIEAPYEQVIWLPRVLGRLEPVDDTSTRIVGSTGNPRWYAEKLAALPVPFRVEGGPELRACVADLGRRMLEAAQE